MAATRAYVSVHLDGAEPCAFHLTGQGPAAFATVELVGTEVMLHAFTGEQLEQLATVATQARAALVERQAVAEPPVRA